MYAFCYGGTGRCSLLKGTCCTLMNAVEHPPTAGDEFSRPMFFDHDQIPSRDEWIVALADGNPAGPVRQPASGSDH